MSAQLTTEFLEDLLQCSLCHDRMREPASLCCGHSFCQACLRQALRHRHECPICRAPCYTVTDPRPNIALASLIQQAFPQTDTERSSVACGEGEWR
mmetsp:Transcript_58618/g.113102  ORF Transcript_58618/g.113102 Transcript_58618/m.113102 type:complete len:96 (+) Transcript_58618:97-384(+)